MSVSCRPLAWRSFSKPTDSAGLATSSQAKGSLKRGLLAASFWVATLALGALPPGLVLAKESPDSAAIGTVSLGQLPPQAQATDKLIYQGGPFPYPKDGIVFGNRERALPRQSRGFYHEYTVPTPGAHNRGARRIVCGGNPPNRPEACYYTDDHYQTFRRITP